MTSPTTLILSKNSLKNTTLDCEERDLHYDIRTEDGITTVRRLDRIAGHYVFVGEWKKHMFRKDEFRIPSQGIDQFVPVSQVCPKTSSKWSDMTEYEHAFVGNDGKKYCWKARGGSMTAHAIDESSDRRGPSIADYHKKRYAFLGVTSSRNPYIDLFPGHEGTLDMLILIFLYAESKRRDGEAANAAVMAS